MDYNEMSLKLHEECEGKLEVALKCPLENKDDLSTAYTPGVAEPCRKIHENPEDAYKYTLKQNTVAVVSDGTAVLGLGDIDVLKLRRSLRRNLISLYSMMISMVLLSYVQQVLIMHLRSLVRNGKI